MISIPKSKADIRRLNLAGFIRVITTRGTTPYRPEWLDFVQAQDVSPSFTCSVDQQQPSAPKKVTVRRTGIFFLRVGGKA